MANHIELVGGPRDGLVVAVDDDCTCYTVDFGGRGAVYNFARPAIFVFAGWTATHDEWMAAIDREMRRLDIPQDE